MAHPIAAECTLNGVMLLPIWKLTVQAKRCAEMDGGLLEYLV